MKKILLTLIFVSFNVPVCTLPQSGPTKLGSQIGYMGMVVAGICTAGSLIAKVVLIAIRDSFAQDLQNSTKEEARLRQELQDKQKQCSDVEVKLKKIVASTIHYNAINELLKKMENEKAQIVQNLKLRKEFAQNLKALVNQTTLIEKKPLEALSGGFVFCDTLDGLQEDNTELPESDGTDRSALLAQSKRHLLTSYIDQQIRFLQDGFDRHIKSELEFKTNAEKSMLENSYERQRIAQEISSIQTQQKKIQEASALCDNTQKSMSTYFWKFGILGTLSYGLLKYCSYSK